MSAIVSRLFDTNSILKNHPPLGVVPPSSEMLQKTIKMAWPSMLEAFLMAMMNFVDVLMVSSMGESAIAAVGLTNQPRMIFFAVFFALQPAIAALVARRRGEENRDSAVRIFKLALLIGFVLVIILSAVALIFAAPIMKLAGAQSDTLDWAVSYFRILLGGMFFSVMTILMNAAQRGAGNTKISMRTNITANVVDLVFNYLLIYGKLGLPALGVAGAAYASIIGQFCGFVMALVSVLHRENFVCLRHHTGGLIDKVSLRSLGKMWGNTFFEQIALRVGFLLYAAILARLGTIAFATHQIAMNFLTVSFAFGEGLSIAAIALVGYSLGQERSDLAKVYGAFCQRIGLICSAVLSVIYIFFGRSLFRLFSDHATVIYDGTIIMWMMTVIVLFQISQLIFSGCLRGSGDNRFITIVSFINISILRPLLAYLFSMVLGWGIIGAWAGLIIDQTVRLALTSMRFYSGRWANIKI